MESEEKIHDLNSTPAVSESNVGVVEPPKISFGKKLLYHLWDADQHLKSPEERAFVRKLDLGILPCATLGWWMKYIDQRNLSNAYVSGMKEELNIQGNEYTYMLICYTIAFAITQIPSNMIALRVTPRYCIVACEIGWTIFTFAQAAAQNSTQLYAFRFMIGLFESGFSPSGDLAYHGLFGQATSGFLQAGIHSSLDGHLGLSGWRWLYIVCGCMSLPVAISVWWLLPDYLHNTTAWYLTEADKQMAIQRAARSGKAEVTGVMDLNLVKRIFGSWRWWVLVLMYIFYGNSCQANSYFAIYLKAEGYSVTQRNVIPACANLVSMVTDFAWGFGSDLTGNRTLWMVGPLLCTAVIGSSILTAWPEADLPKVVAFFFVSGGYVTAVTWTWANEINSGNAQERALTISSMNGIFYATNYFLPILIFPQTTGPKFPRGFPSILAFSLMAIILIFVADFLHKRQLRQEAEAESRQPASEAKVKILDEKKHLDVDAAVVRASSEIV